MLIGLNMVPVSAAVPIPFAMKNVSGEGDERVFSPASETEAGAKAALDGLAAMLARLG